MTSIADAVGGMMVDFLAEAGESVTYIRGTSSTVMTLSISSPPSQYIDNGQGGILEVQPVVGKGLTSDFPFDPPLAGDKVVTATATYELQPTAGEKPFRRISPQMTTILMSRIAG